MNISNYLQATVGSAQPAPTTLNWGFTGSTGDAVAFSTNYGFPTGTTGFDMSGFEGIRAIAVVINSTFAALQPTISKGTSGGVLTTSSGWAVTSSTAVTTLGALTAYSTALTILEYDLYRPIARYVDFYASVASSSAAVLGIIVDQYGPKREATISGQFQTGSTVFVSPSTS